MRPTKKKPQPEFIVLPEIESSGHRPTGIGRKLVGICGVIGCVLIVYGGLVIMNFPAMICGTVLICIATLASN